VGLSPAK